LDSKDDADEIDSGTDEGIFHILVCLNILLYCSQLHNFIKVAKLILQLTLLPPGYFS